MRDGTYGFAIVGCGVISSFHAESIASIPNARLRAVVDAIPRSGPSDDIIERGLPWQQHVLLKQVGGVAVDRFDLFAEC